MFIETTLGHLINTDHVAQVGRSRGQPEKARCVMAGNGDTVEVYASSVDELVAAQSLIPAQPGFTLLTFYLLGGDEYVERSPVIAWQVDPANGYHKAIGLYWPSDNASMTGVLCPDGRVIDPANTIYDSEDDWRIAARKEAVTWLAIEQKEREEKAAKAKEHAA
jgi:hypothetical protein